jgi:hypothetical protein
VALNQYKANASQFATTLTTTSTASGSTGFLLSTQAADFGFNAALLKIAADGAGSAYVQLNGNPATSSDFKLSTGDAMADWYDVGSGVCGVSIGSTSTSFSGRIGAWG